MSSPCPIKRVCPTMDLLGVCTALQVYPDVAATFSYADIIRYIKLVALLKPTPVLAYLQPSYQLSVPPLTLPANVHEFLKGCFALEDETAKLAWEAFREISWAYSPTLAELEALHVQLLLIHGIPNDIGVYSLHPPTRVCLDPDCAKPLYLDPSVLRDRELGEARSHKAVVFSLELGAMPAISTSCYCRNCHTRYYANYYVHGGATTRTYYLEDILPEYKHIQSAEHFYTSSDLCELFANMMVSAWTSSTNCARIYNMSISKQALQTLLPADWSLRFQMDGDDVFDSFFLHALILDHCEHGDILELRHDAPSQSERLRPALEARNAHMVGPGQEEWNHVCELCSYIVVKPGGQWVVDRSVVTDGHTIGHYCCSVHNCQGRLRTVKDSFCADHDTMRSICCITTCDALAEQGHRTCSDSTHCEAEEYHYQRGKAMFQLHARLERTKAAVPTASFASDLLVGSEDSDVDQDAYEEEECQVEKPAQGNRKLRARFGRRRTHNEQLAVHSCGVIAGRATFFGSEAPNGVVEFWMKLYPTKQSVPSIMWLDMNCSVQKMLAADETDFRRKYFEGIAFPVDVFHFKCKHAEGDIFCGLHCNPANWPILRTEDGKWRFNSSAAEQTNAWFGGFHSIVREMVVERYNFFQDEMIKRRNRIVVAELQKGKQPMYISQDVLLSADSIGSKEV
ncbi:hypothetical protein GGX14DRAFT_564870 [Mycena pura]|uniref:CxC5 like cysteine cluster associated with KDZ domain-containing protein n=1 Tax=Mycena pura TaxID=153505 RepID=A0AAD6VN49_9AGAR|nr:hypothetical protein GGX14DRAFT_564870 [Mycena pura]